MWGSSRYSCYPEWPRASSLGSSDRKQRKNYTSKLHELALLLPVGLKTGSRKLTKKEILLHVLHYIRYLQRSITVAKALLKLHAASGKGGPGGLGRNHTVGPSRRRHSTPSSSPHSYKSCLQGAYRKPRKKKLQRGSGYYFRKRAQGDGPYTTFKAQQRAERIHFLNRTQSCPRQKVVFYDSSEEVDNESPDADPWLPAWIPEGGQHGSPPALGPSLNDTWSVPGHPAEILGLSPSLFSSPGKLLPEQILEDGAEYLTQDLFEEVFSNPVSSPFACVLKAPQKDVPSEVPKEPLHSLRQCQSSVSQDHCYLVLSDSSKGPSSPSSKDSNTDTDTDSVWKQQQHAQAKPEGPKSSSEEDGDYTWTPTRQASTLTMAGRKMRKGWTGRGSVKPKKKRTAPCPTQIKKKCVNGFIMFCRMNRKPYIRACPGTASTAATKELAQLWRTMTPQERKPYCTKARRFSRRHNRIVKQESSSSEDEDMGTPKPFYQLLAEKAHRCPELPSRLPPRRK